MQLDASFWRGRRVFVTGHAGFKGSWLVIWLAELGAEVTGFGHAPRWSPALLELAGLAGRLRATEGDVRDREALADALRRAEPELVFHLAARPIVFHALADPVDTLETNLLGTLNLLEAIRRTPSVRAVVVVTSDKCYREPFHACRETDPLGGDEPYAASKACAEIVTHAWRSAFLSAREGIGVATARAGNVIGGGDWSAHRLIPDLVRAFVAGTPPVLRRPGAIRPWQHVLDALSGYLLLAQALARDPQQYASAWNFGPDPGGEWTVAEIAAAVSRRLGVGRWQVAQGPIPPEPALQRLCNERARRRLGWKPRLSTAEAVEWTVEGYRELLETGKADWLFDQIRRYRLRMAETSVRPPRAPAPAEPEVHHGLSASG
ncbi:MAG: CDP-glucose 4,6-dehydratase [Geminicoccaceae bacterium]|nr:CDP-glucose 4,6-dehydratase [Geminicoccaceae bacterium]MCS7266904.1 CDP-glucose 4,6-dehydratase [Geminicoccaceae bacterium]MCX7628831.1 CDP-glucose 4,6-dehydratase [Geminicoccaceae bacterium]MDW8124172.1 CDP-glucose 4,6-dehydratase [Geminicoccaceae bacterium]MDW8340605.1 CDP-glucose 4,6-dehydratase [Geminicoccaceae bacterium]